MAVTLSQLRALRLAKTACQRNGVGPMTLKHRALSGTQATVGNNTILKARSGTATLESTTDSQVYVVWMPQKMRGGVDGGDSPAGRTSVRRVFAQCTALDVNANPVTLWDDDWIVAPDGQFYKVENPAISPDGGYYMFEMVSQQ